ncbi:class I SAM-dependent methyltransferase [Methylolobus aquaticus]|nr:class I SAM-dependent methyltransferase [Methylolobus aquaticus]
MRWQDEQAIPFGDFLDAKFFLDERSLNGSVRQALVDECHGRGRLSCLDLGSGTGAMIRRLLRWFPNLDLSITALDQDPDLLATARRRIVDELRNADLVVKDKGSWLRGESIARTVNVEFACCRIAEFNPPPARYDLITAHAVVDLLDPSAVRRKLEEWLIPGGYWYASLNYDGGTFLFPSFDDPGFEQELLNRYDRSMEERRVEGTATGGAHSGTRLLAALATPDWDTVAYGSSDWNLTPLRNSYRDRDSVCLQAMLGFIRGEGERGALDAAPLVRWTATRSRQLAAGQLGIIVHQLDVLARYRPSVAAPHSAAED